MSESSNPKPEKPVVTGEEKPNTEIKPPDMSEISKGGKDTLKK